MSTLYIQLFGAFQVTVDNQPWEHFRSDKVRALLAYLALEGATPRRRSQLMILFWSGFKPTFARANLRMSLANLRQLLAPFGLLQTTRQAVRWSLSQPNWTCDALVLQQVLQEEQRTDAERWQVIERLYQGEFLPGFEQIDSLPWQLWLQDRRADYAQQVEEARQRWRPSRNAFAAPDWGAIPRTAQFHGRLCERNTLRQWLVDEHCQLVAIFGLGGQGKTALAATFVRDLTATTLPEGMIADQSLSAARFTHVVWRSLHNAPPLSEILLSWLQILANQQITHLPALVEDQLALLVKYLQSHPTLLVLDNLECVLQSGGHAGRYQPGYETYGELLRRLAASDHQSCLVLISREQPQEFHRLQTQEATIRALHLRGLEQNDALQILQDRSLRASAGALTTLIQRYAGQPLALQVAAETIQEFFGGKLADFLAQASLILADLATTLDQHFARLSVLEQTILIWLAIEDGPITRQTLLAQLIAPPSLSVYLEAERSLLRRFLIETYGERLGLQSLLRTYLTDHLIHQIYMEVKPAPEEINTNTHRSQLGQLKELAHNEGRTGESTWPARLWAAHSYLNRYRLGPAQSNNYSAQSQGSLILQAVAQQIIAHFGLAHVFAHLHECLDSLQQELAPPPGYAIPNLIHLLRQLGVDEYTPDLVSGEAITGHTGRLHLLNN